MEENKYLAHYGIKGQQWGERRYRNYDGTLTDAGKARYRTAESNNAKKSTYDRKHLTFDRNPAFSKKMQYRMNKDDRNFSIDKAYAITKNLSEASKNVSNIIPDKKKINEEAAERNKARNELMKKMNDQELRDTVNRLNMERQYHTLTDEPVYEDGKNTTKKIIDGFGTALTLTATGLVVAKAALDLIDRFKK